MGQLLIDSDGDGCSRLCGPNLRPIPTRVARVTTNNQQNSGQLAQTAPTKELLIPGRCAPAALTTTLYPTSSFAMLL